MNWLKSLFALINQQKADSNDGKIVQSEVAYSEPAIKIYNEAAILFNKGKYKNAESLFLSVANDSKTTSLRKIAAGAAILCQMKRGISFSPNLFPPEMRDDSNGLLVAFMASNIALNYFYESKNLNLRAEGLTWYVNVNKFGLNYEFRVTNTYGQTIGHVCRIDTDGEYLYLPDLEQDPTKFHPNKLSDSQILSWHRMNIKANANIILLPSDGLQSFLTEDNYRPPSPNVNTRIWNINT
jgi:hypothetical protein